MHCFLEHETRAQVNCCPFFKSLHDSKQVLLNEIQETTVDFEFPTTLYVLLIDIRCSHVVTDLVISAIFR